MTLNGVIFFNMYTSKGPISALNGLVLCYGDQYKGIGPALASSCAGDFDSGVVDRIGIWSWNSLCLVKINKD